MRGTSCESFAHSSYETVRLEVGTAHRCVVDTFIPRNKHTIRFVLGTDSTRMKLFKSQEPNTFHYTTSVCHRRVPVFRRDKACELFIEALAEARRRFALKLIGYVIMSDHTHMILNPLCCDISKVMNSLQSAAARGIIDWLRESKYKSSLEKLALNPPKKRGHTRAVWQPDFSCIDHVRYVSDSFRPRRAGGRCPPLNEAQLWLSGLAFTIESAANF